MGRLRREVVVTGMGMVTPIGLGRHSFWEAMLQGRSGIGRVQVADWGTLPHPVGGELLDFDPHDHVKPRKVLKIMCREVGVAFTAANLAVEDAGLDQAAIDKERFGVIFGSEMFYGHPGEMAAIHRQSLIEGQFDIRAFGAKLESEMFPLWLLKYLPNMSACHIGIAHQALGANNTIVQGSASGLLALAEAVAVIQRGWCDVMITGAGGTSLNPMRAIYQTDELISKRDSAPFHDPRPFDADRDGLVRGEGCCTFIIESREHADARGATSLCRIGGVGRSVGPVSEVRYVGATQAAIERSIEQALSAADCRPADIGHVNAEGLATVDADEREAKAIRALLGDCPVTAPKSLFGYLSAGSGAVEMAASVLALMHGKVPHTLNYQTPDPACPVNVIHGQPLNEQHEAALLLNQSSTGQAVAAVLQRA